MNNEPTASGEPVAWIGKNELQFGFTDTIVTNEKESWDDIPLYTHPASLVDWSYQQGYQVGKETHPSKDLTDEEDTECQYCKQGCIRCDARKLLTDEEISDVINNEFGHKFNGYEICFLYAFARAILRKAQEN